MECPQDDPLGTRRCSIRLEMYDFLLLLGIQPSLTSSLSWRLLKAAILDGHTDGLTIFCHHWSTDS